MNIFWIVWCGSFSVLALISMRKCIQRDMWWSALLFFACLIIQVTALGLRIGVMIHGR